MQCVRTAVNNQLDSALFQFTALLVEADLASRRGDEGRVMKALARAMPLGRSHGYVNTWMWSPKMMAELAARALDADIEVDYVRRLVRERKLVPAEAPLEVETWPWPVKVFTLGRFEVLTGERPVRFAGKAQRKPLALLQALIALGGQRVREARLTEALWPDADGDAAHQALSTTLHRLRRLIGRQAGELRLRRQMGLVGSAHRRELFVEVHVAVGKPEPAHVGDADHLGGVLEVLLRSEFEERPRSVFLKNRQLARQALRVLDGIDLTQLALQGLQRRGLRLLLVHAGRVEVAHLL